MYEEPSSPTFLFISRSPVAMETLEDRDIPWQCTSIYCHSQTDSVTLENNERETESNKDNNINCGYYSYSLCNTLSSCLSHTSYHNLCARFHISRSWRAYVLMFKKKINVYKNLARNPQRRRALGRSMLIYVWIILKCILKKLNGVWLAQSE
jgi:hypothetical protein